MNYTNRNKFCVYFIKKRYKYYLITKLINILMKEFINSSNYSFSKYLTYGYLGIIHGLLNLPSILNKVEEIYKRPYQIGYLLVALE